MVDAAIEKHMTGAEDVTWDLSVFYDSLDDPRIGEDMTKLDEMATTYAARYKGRVGQLDATELAEAIQMREAILDLSGRIGSFASLNFSTNSSDPKIGALMQKVTEFGAKLSQLTVFFNLEWDKLEDEVVATLLDSPELEKYRFKLEAERRYKPYRLSEIEEQLLIEKSVTGQSAWTRFFNQLISSMRFEWDGEKINESQILKKIRDENRDIRHKAADVFTAGLRDKAMELTYITNVLAADKASNDNRRGYPTWVTSRNLSNLAPDSVVEALIETVTSNYEIVARHYRLKRVLLGVDELQDYDRYAPLPTKDSEKLYSWDEARKIVVNAFRAFNPRMAEVAELFFDENWIHAPVLPDKRGGAFASPTVPSAHPFVFVNYQGKPNDVMTLAHELGHGIPLYLSGQANGFQGLYTPLTTAEMASVFAEMLVFQDLMRRESDAEVRLSMLCEKIEATMATVFRQVSMNRYEHGLHTARRTEGELSTERISEIWMETQRAMFGDSVNLRDEYAMWWSYVPHFLHTPGYVYAYAFGELLVLALYKLYEERGEDFVPQYIGVLEAGGSDYPDRILGKVGVDLNDLNFWAEGIAVIEKMVADEEQLAREVYPEKFA